MGPIRPARALAGLEAIREAGVGFPPQLGLLRLLIHVRLGRPGRLDRFAGGLLGVQFGVDPGRFGLVLAHQLDELRGEERQADQVAEDPQRSPADDLVCPQAGSPRPAQRFVVGAADQGLSGDDVDSENRVSAYLGNGYPNGDAVVVGLLHRIDQQPSP